MSNKSLMNTKCAWTNYWPLVRSFLIFVGTRLCMGVDYVWVETKCSLLLEVNFALRITPGWGYMCIMGRLHPGGDICIMGDYTRVVIYVYHGAITPGWGYMYHGAITPGWGYMYHGAITPGWGYMYHGAITPGWGYMCIMGGLHPGGDICVSWGDYTRVGIYVYHGGITPGWGYVYHGAITPGWGYMYIMGRLHPGGDICVSWGDYTRVVRIYVYHGGLHPGGGDICISWGDYTRVGIYVYHGENYTRVMGIYVYHGGITPGWGYICIMGNCYSINKICCMISCPEVITLIISLYVVFVDFRIYR